jgi:hypothetical protein
MRSANKLLLKKERRFIMETTKWVIRNISKTIRKEFREFEEEQLKMSTKLVFENCGKIYFYRNLYDFFSDEDFYEILRNSFIQKQLLWFNSEIENPLSSLFDFYIDQEFMFVNNYEQIEELLREYVKKYFKEEEEEEENIEYKTYYILTKNGENDFEMYCNDLPTNIFDKYSHEGSSVRGTKSQIIADLIDSLY